jgi:hypothetical protein
MKTTKSRTRSLALSAALIVIGCSQRAATRTRPRARDCRRRGAGAVAAVPLHPPARAELAGCRGHLQDVFAELVEADMDGNDDFGKAIAQEIGSESPGEAF